MLANFCTPMHSGTNQQTSGWNCKAILGITTNISSRLAPLCTGFITIHLARENVASIWNHLPQLACKSSDYCLRNRNTSNGSRQHGQHSNRRNRSYWRVYKTGAEADAGAETVAFFCHAYNLWHSCAGQEMSQRSLNKWIKHILCAFLFGIPKKWNLKWLKPEVSILLSRYRC